ncbi:MAG: succinyl-diaminopimelate desuccinylase [Succinatimonas hippei]|nr:succinyl-diaminopimelate desuccinylase [Succinatimonas hippei]
MDERSIATFNGKGEAVASKKEDLHPALELLKDLISRPSITPEDKGCQGVIAERLASCGFRCFCLGGSGAVNLIAVHGQGEPSLMFLGHTDVVPPGDPGKWRCDPFTPTLFDDEGVSYLYGRGASDMKASDAAMTVALCDFVRKHPAHKGRCMLLLTSNEEGDSRGGTPKAAEFLKNRDLVQMWCLVGEPSCFVILGDQYKHGRRGSLSCDITVKGIQGHVAYPERCDNAAHHAAALMHELSEIKWDDGSDSFPPTSFQITNIRCGTGAENVAPGECFFMCNWRFNPLSTPQMIKERFEKALERSKASADTVWRLNGLPFETQKGEFSEALLSAIKNKTGISPRFSTSGGTSDGRFIAPLGSEVMEFGPPALSIHGINERVKAEDPDLLASIYEDLLSKLLL